MLRDATAEEIERLGIPNVGETWACVWESNGEITGHLALSCGNGVCFGHSTKCWDEDKTVALRLWLRGRAKAREMGYKNVQVHLNADTAMAEFWANRGFKEIYRVLEGEI